MTALPVFALAVLAAVSQQATPAAKPADTGCVALLLPSVDGVEDSTAVASSIRTIFESYLTGPSLKSVPLDARLSSQAMQEAVQKECTKVLTVTVTRKQSGGGGSKLGAVAHAAGTSAAYIPLPNYGSAIAVGAARSSAEAVASVARTTRAKDEFTMTYKVETTDGAVVVPQKTDKAKAKSDGEDLLTPLIARASETIGTAVAKR
jgi:hypothetical protein